MRLAVTLENINLSRGQIWDQRGNLANCHAVKFPKEMGTALVRLRF